MVVVGLLIFCVNMFLAWRTALATNDYIQQPLLTEGSDASAALKQIQQADTVHAMVYRRLIEGHIHMKAISNKQTTAIVGMAAGFGFLAIGFSLALMAIRGAFEFSAGANGRGDLVLRSASPGILCFVLGAAIIIVALLQDSSLRFGDVHIEEKPAHPKKEESRPKIVEPTPLAD